MFQNLGIALNLAKRAVNAGNNDASKWFQLQYPCRDFKLKVCFGQERLRRFADILQQATKLLKGGCESQAGESSAHDDGTTRWGKKLMEYATENGFGGCGDNK